MITGATGQVVAPVALALAADSEVRGVARFTDPATRERLEKADQFVSIWDRSMAARFHPHSVRSR